MTTSDTPETSAMTLDAAGRPTGGIAERHSARDIDEALAKGATAGV